MGLLGRLFGGDSGTSGAGKCIVCGGKIRPQPTATIVAGTDFTGPASEFSGTCGNGHGTVHFRCAEIERKDFGGDMSFTLVKCPVCGSTIQRID